MAPNFGFHLCTFFFMFLIWVFYPSMIDTVIEVLDVFGYYTEYIL